MSILDSYGPQFRKAGLQEWHKKLTGILDSVNARTGGKDPAFVDSITPQSSAKPKGTLLSVAAASGVFIVTVLNPQDVVPISANLRSLRAQKGGLNAHLTPIRHNVQSATSLNFDASSGLLDHGTTTQTKISLPLGTGLALYWRWRSSFDGQNWTNWQVLGGPSGPIQVQS